MVAQLRTRLNVERLGDRIVPALYTWDYYGSGLGDASDPTNWAEQAVPLDGDDVYVPAASGGIDATSLSAIGTWTIEAEWDNTWLTNGLTVSGGGSIRDARIEMWGHVSLNGTMTFGDVWFTSPHPTEVSYLYLSADPEILAQDKTLEGVFLSDAPVVNKAKLTLPAGTRVDLSGGATFRNEGRVVFQDTAEFRKVGAAATSFTNTSTGTVTVEKGNVIIGPLFLNQGRVEVLASQNPSSLTFGAQVTIPPGLEVSVISDGGTWVLYGGNTDFQTSRTLLSQNDLWLIYYNGVAAANGNVVRVFGDLSLTGSTIQFGGVGPVGGDLKVSHDGKLSLTNTTVTVTLNWTKNSIDRWEAKQVAISGGVLAMGVEGEPNPIPAGKNWDVLVAADAAITGTFTNYLLGPSYGHEFDATGRRFRIKT